MSTLGDMLREAREERGISLPEAERETKIRQKYILALEDDNLAALPGPVYARGFLRLYASYLGVNPDEAQEMFDEQSRPTRSKLREARGKPAVPSKSTPKTDKISIQPLSPEPIDTRVRYGSQYIAVSLLALPLIVVFYFVYNAYAGGTRSAPIPNPTITLRPPTVTALPSISAVVGSAGTGAFNTPTVLVPPTPVAAVITPTLVVTPTAAAAQATIPAAANVTVKVATTRDAWMRVLVDGVQKFSGTLPAGSTRQWTGNSTIRIRTGRADAVDVTINGVDKGLMGDPNNQIVEKEWDKTGGEKIIQ